MMRLSKIKEQLNKMKINNGTSTRMAFSRIFILLNDH